MTIAVKGPAEKPASKQEAVIFSQNRRRSGWLSCHRSMTALPMMLEPLIGPQKRLSQEIARLSPIT